MRDYLRKLAPDRFEDLIALLALRPPRPLGERHGGRFFIPPQEGQTPWRTRTPGASPSSSPPMASSCTKSRSCHRERGGGFTLGQADLLRRAMGSKDPEVMERQRGRFLAGAKERDGAPPSRKLVQPDGKFAGYGFNKSHSTPTPCGRTARPTEAHFPPMFMGVP
jgi:DNA polymerase-3 subunit alpha